MRKYIALTIGPIYKTLSSARKTQELWGSSYMFSYIMKEIIKTFRERSFVVPHVDDSILDNPAPTQVGLFHDRFIFESEPGDKELLKSHIKEVVENLASEIDIEYDYLQQYLQIHYKEFDDVESNPILGTSNRLDTMELKYQTAPSGDNQVKEALKNKENYFKQMIFPNARPFPSLPEIALHDIISPEIRNRINRDDDNDDEPSIYEDREFNQNFKPYHKYIAIVHADGDNIGKVVTNLKTGEFATFSENLFKYCTKSAELIEEYGGETIFAGGDDLLFFAPVSNLARGENIFSLIEKISKVFDGLFSGYNIDLQANNIPEQATLSFGVNITYYKYPLYEALEESRNLLFDKAKNTGEKNNIAFSVTKHSGQQFGSVISKSDIDIYEQFLSLVEHASRLIDADNFLHSLHHKLDAYSVLINNIANDKAKLTNFFANFFNEDVHQQADIIFAAMIEYIHASYQKGDSIKEALERVYASLRFIKFLQGDKS